MKPNCLNFNQAKLEVDLSLAKKNSEKKTAAAACDKRIEVKHSLRRKEVKVSEVAASERKTKERPRLL